MGIPIPTGFTISNVSTTNPATISVASNAIDTVNGFFYTASDLTLNKFNVTNNTAVIIGGVPAHFPNSNTNLSVDGSGFLWYYYGDTSTPIHRILSKTDPVSLATLGSFDMSTNWGWIQQTYLGNTVNPATGLQWPTQDGKIVVVCPWTSGDTSAAKPNPFVGCVNASTLANIGTFTITLPVGTPSNYFLYHPPNGNYWVDVNQNGTGQAIPILDEQGFAYIIAKATRQGTSVPVVFDWYIWKIDLTAMTGVTWHFTGNSTVGAGQSMIYDVPSSSLFVKSTTGYIFKVDRSTGTINSSTLVVSPATRDLAVLNTQGKTQNGVFFTINISTTKPDAFIKASDLSVIGNFVDTSGVTWLSGFDTFWSYFPSSNYIAVPTPDNYPVSGGTTPSTLIYHLAQTNTCSKTQVIGGSFTDSYGAPLAGGKVVFSLSYDSEVSCTAAQICSGVSVSVTLDSTGNIPSSPVFSLWPNDILVNLINSTFYYMTVYSSQGEQILNTHILVPTSSSPWNVGTATIF